MGSYSSGKSANGGRSQSSSGSRQGSGQTQGQSKASYTEYKFFAHGTSNKQGQTLTYSHVKDYIVKYVQKTYDNGDDIEVSLRKEEILYLSAEMPVREASVAESKDVKKFEQDGFDIKY